MINLLLGAPGGGKSYEATVFHILPAVKSGRHVVTNLPLLPEAWERLNPDWPSRIHLLQQAPGGHRPFSVLADYEFDWRDPETGRGPLFVIDECQMVLPRRDTPREIIEWFEMHRHEGADVLLLTQSYGKVCREIVDLVQLVYRVRKNVALGSTNTYTRKVQDGVRGAVVNEEQRRYKSAYFPLYKSHTKASKEVLEDAAKDVKPIWKHWTFRAAAFMFVLATVILWRAGSPLKPTSPVVAKEPVESVAEQQPIRRPAPPKPLIRRDRLATGEYAQAASVQPAEPSPAVQTEESPPERNEVLEHPYKGRGIHVIGYIASEERELYLFGISQNGQQVFFQTLDEVVRAGYKVEPMNDCAARISYGDWETVAICDVPGVTIKKATMR